MSMDKVKITSALGTSENQYKAPVSISVNGIPCWPLTAPEKESPDANTASQGNAPAADSSASTNAAAGALLGGGSGGYAGGGVGGTAPETANVMQVVDIAFVPGGITHIPYPTGSQKRYRLVGVVPGLGALAFMPEAGRHPGGGRFSITGGELDSCPLDDSAIGSEAGVFVGGSILRAYGKSNHFSEAFQVGEDKGPGYGPVLPTNAVTFVNVKFGTGVPSNLTVEVAAHDR